jgi:YVTN family beta-propeller protein
MEHLMKSKRFTIVVLTSIFASLILSASAVDLLQASSTVKPLVAQDSAERTKSEPSTALSASIALQAALARVSYPSRWPSISLTSALPANTHTLTPQDVGPTIVATVTVGSGSYGIGVNPTTNRVYVSNYYSDTVSVIDGASHTIVATVPVGTGPYYGVGVNPMTNRVYVANGLSDNVSVIDGVNNTVVATVTVGYGPYGIGVNPTTNRIYVANFYNDDVSVIDGANNAVVATVPVGTGPYGVGVNPTTNRVYVSNFYSNTISVIDGANNTIVATVTVGTWPVAIGVNPTTNRVYVRVSNTVSVIDGASNTVVATVTMENPGGVGVNSTTNRVYVTSGVSNTVSVIDGASNTIVATVMAGSGPRAIGVNPTTNRVYVTSGVSNTVSVIQDVVPPLPDLGFRPNPDGYSFSNYGGVNAADLTTEDMRTMFGDAAVCQTVGATCTVKPAASKWNTWVNDQMSSGHCDGFTTTSLRFYAGLDNPATYQTGAQHAYDLQLSNIRRRIAYFWVLQVPAPVATARTQALQKTPTDVLTQLRTAMSGGVASNATTLIVYNAQRTSGHSIAPYAIEDRGGGVSWVKVYDNNYPDDANRYVVITTTTNSWGYDLGWMTWSGDASTNSLGAIPISEYATSPTCPWCSGASLSAPANVSLGQVGYTGPGNLLITNEQGQRLGFNGSQFVNEISGAFESVLPGGLGTTTQPIYYLPITSTYTILLDGQAVAGQAAPTQAQSAPASFAFFGPGYAVSLADDTMNTSAHNVLRVAPDGKQLAYQPSGQSAATMTLALDGATQSYRFDVGEVDVVAGQAVTLTANTTDEKLILDNSNNGAATYALKIARVSASGEQVFVHSDVAITATDTQYINYGTWNGADEVTVQIDQGSNGSIDQTITLDNQLKRVYLPLIMK